VTATIDRHTITANLPSGDEVAVGEGYLQLDEILSPFARAELQVTRPADLVGLDPRTDDPRIILNLLREFSDSDTVADLSAAYGAGTVAALTAFYGGVSLAYLSQAHNLNWVPGETRPPQRRTADLALRSRIDNGDGTFTITLSSDEAYLQDYAPWGGDDDPGVAYLYADPFNSTGSLNSLVRWVVLRVLPDAVLEFSTLDYDISDLYVQDMTGNGYLWIAGQSAWEFLAPLVQVSGGRLWCDEQRVWHFDRAPVSAAGSLLLEGTGSITDYSGTLSREGDSDWYNAVVIIYEWNDPVTDQKLIGKDSAPDAASWPALPRVLTIRHADTVNPGPGAASNLLARSLARGYDIPTTATSDFTARPGMAVSIEPDDTPYTAVLASVRWDFERAEMDVTLRDVEA
jgi:hypothetical protein